MSWFSKIIHKVTNYNELKEKIDKLENLNSSLADKINTLTFKIENDDSLSVLEKDRDELFKRNDKLFKRNDELFKRNDELLQKLVEIEQKLNSDNVSILEKDRDELFKRNDELLQKLIEIEQKLNSDNVSILEKDRDELFKRNDKLLQKLIEIEQKLDNDNRLTILEKDRDSLFLRVDDLIRRIDYNMGCNKEDNQVTLYVLRKEMRQVLRNIGFSNKKNSIHFIRCLDIHNTGDMNCGPDLYFEELMEGRSSFFHSIKNIDFGIIKKNDWVIIGGGGMLDCSPQYQDAIKKVLNCSNHVVSWGLGHNKHYSDSIYDEQDCEPIDYNKFFLFTSRDWNYDQSRFCPCVSCMMRGLDKNYIKKRKVGVFTHHEIRITEFDFDICDNSQPIGEILKFLGESEVIITNTYHGSYWATLLGVKVIIYNPFSNRFDYSKYDFIRYSGDLEKDILLAKSYPNALKECRKLNIALKDELLELMRNLD